MNRHDCFIIMDRISKTYRFTSLGITSHKPVGSRFLLINKSINREINLYLYSNKIKIHPISGSPHTSDAAMVPWWVKWPGRGKRSTTRLPGRSRAKLAKERSTSRRVDYWLSFCMSRHGPDSPHSLKSEH